jgi:hypothetical protein
MSAPPSQSTATWSNPIMLPTILIIVAVIVVLLILIIAIQPSDFRVERSATMSAPASEVFGQINDFHKWDAWSPWAKIDPDMKQSYEGAAAGTGAVYSWNGNKQVGEGRMTILESKPNELIRIKLEFLKPFKATHTAEFSFHPFDKETTVTWAMIGRKNFIFKAFTLLMSMDKMVGRDFEKGLAQIKAVVEKGS